jgi:hypothetical protein
MAVRRLESRQHFYGRCIDKFLRAAFFISIILGSAESDLYWSVGATFIQIIDESTFIHPNVCTFIQNRAIPP